jgi:hypothetical protein
MSVADDDILNNAQFATRSFPIFFIIPKYSSKSMLAYSTLATPARRNRGWLI